MGCPSQITINKTLVFSITTHNPSGGGVQDADALPSYRIYDTQGAQIWPPSDWGEMTRFDDANTTGFYLGMVDCTPANGFAENSNYTLYIEASVEGDVGAISFEFEVAAVPDYSFNIDTTDLIVAIREYLSNVEVRPTKTILGPCKQTVKQFAMPKRCP